MVRRHLHDLRNCVNYLDLQSSLLLECFSDSDAISQLQTMKSELAAVEGIIRSLSARVTPHPLATISVADLYTKWRRQLEITPNGARPSWGTSRLDAQVITNVGLLVTVLSEIVGKLHQLQPKQGIAVRLDTNETGTVIEIRATGTDKPMFEDDQSHEWARMIEDAGARLSRTFDPAIGLTLVQVAFPVVA